MRDPKRIPRILRKLERVWKEHPDWRLGQVLRNSVPSEFLEDATGTGRIAAFQDEQWEEWLDIEWKEAHPPRSFVREMKRRKKEPADIPAEEVYRRLGWLSSEPTAEEMDRILRPGNSPEDSLRVSKLTPTQRFELGLEISGAFRKKLNELEAFNRALSRLPPLTPKQKREWAAYRRTRRAKDEILVREGIRPSLEGLKRKATSEEWFAGEAERALRSKTAAAKSQDWFDPTRYTPDPKVAARYAKEWERPPEKGPSRKTKR